MAGRTKSKVVLLPNTYERWPEVGSVLTNIRDGEVCSLEDFERLYPRLEFERPHRVSQIPTFSSLRRVLRNGKHFTTAHFLSTLLPWIAAKALQVQELFKDKGHRLPLLLCQMQEEVTLTRDQVCCLIAHAFFGTFAPVGSGFQLLAMTSFLEDNSYKSQSGKLLCILNYFDRLRRAEVEGKKDFLAMNISVRRWSIEVKDADKFWGECDLPLVSFSTSEGVIEKSEGDLQVDFANEYIGGGVLQLGNVQEEIRFVINPECIMSMLICEGMEDNEAILIQGAEQFSKYKGYGCMFDYVGPYEDPNPIDSCNRRCVSIVAIDATPMPSLDASEYQKNTIARELWKALCGFSMSIPGDNAETKELRPVATGNWGCGAFGGNKQLKTLEQWMAATVAGRPVKYYTFTDKKLAEQQATLLEALKGERVTVGRLYRFLVSSEEELEVNEHSVFQILLERMKQGLV